MQPSIPYWFCHYIHCIFLGMPGRKKTSIKMIQSYDTVSPSPLQIKDTLAAWLTPQQHHEGQCLAGGCRSGWLRWWHQAQNQQPWRHKVPLEFLLPHLGGGLIPSQFHQHPDSMAADYLCWRNSQQQIEALRKQKRQREVENAVCRFCLPRAFMPGFTIKNT